MPLTKLINNLKELQTYVVNTLDSTVNEDFQRITELEKERLSKGINADGERLERKDSDNYPYSPAYKKFKRAKGGQVDVVDLKLNGDYHRGINTQKTGKLKGKIYSTDSKEKFLPNQYEKIHGVSPQDKNTFEKEYSKKVIQVTRKKITSK